MDFTSTEAILYARENRIAEWVDQFLTKSKFLPNLEMAEQLRQRPTFWRGPLICPLRTLVRVCGPEPGMPFHEESEIWNQKVDSLSVLLEGGIELPPLFVKVRNSKHFISDGAHRHEVLIRSGRDEYWTLWYAHEQKELDSVDWNTI